MLQIAYNYFLYCFCFQDIHNSPPLNQTDNVLNSVTWRGLEVCDFFMHSSPTLRKIFFERMWIKGLVTNSLFAEKLILAVK